MLKLYASPINCCQQQESTRTSNMALIHQASFKPRLTFVLPLKAKKNGNQANANRPGGEKKIVTASKRCFDSHEKRWNFYSAKPWIIPYLEVDGRKTQSCLIRNLSQFSRTWHNYERNKRKIHKFDCRKAGEPTRTSFRSLTPLGAV